MRTSFKVPAREPHSGESSHFETGLRCYRLRCKAKEATESRRTENRTVLRRRSAQAVQEEGLTDSDDSDDGRHTHTSAPLASQRTALGI